jgi:prevent-host-death family protein
MPRIRIRISPKQPDNHKDQRSPLFSSQTIFFVDNLTTWGGGYIVKTSIYYRYFIQECIYMETYKVGELKNKFSQVLQRVQAGEEIIVSSGKKGKKIAVLVPYDKYISASPRRLGLLKGKAQCTIKDDFQMSDEELLRS